MLISLNVIKKYVEIPAEVSDQELIELIGSRLVEIEEVIDLTPKYKGSYVVKVVKCEPIEGTHLHLCQIDAGDITSEFSDGETVQIVCGAPNVHAGMLAVWITPGSIVPSTYGHENFRLGKRKLQGYESNGMLAGADELDFDTEHKSIAEIDPKIARPGDALADVFALNDLILDVENKSLTHRPDCFGLIGFAREVAGILGLKFKEPAFFDNLDVKLAPASLDLNVKIESDDLCPRYSCAVFDLPKHEPSKYLTHDAVFLAKAGMRAIDPMVDLTNIIMLETGQPLHAFDYDKLLAVGGAKTPTIIVRAAKDGEPLQLLDGKTIACTPDDVLITSNNVPVALAGAMGGKNTEIDASTTRVVLESATFSLYHLRKTQMAHGIFSEAITRFTKGQPAAMTLPVLNETIRRLDVTPFTMVDEYPGKVKPSTISLTIGQINSLLGTNYDIKAIIDTLENVGFEVASTSSRGDKSESKLDELNEPPVKTGGRVNASKEMLVTSPAWRTDIHIAEDVIEEVGRLLGFDNIPLDLPEKSFSGTESSPLWQLKQELRGILSDRLAMNELLTYSFISRDLLEKVGQDPDDSYEIVNSISPELQCFRQQIVPSLLDKIRENIKAGHKDFTLYELNQVSLKSSGLTDEGTPVLKNHLGIVSLSDFYALKARLLALFKMLGLKVAYSALSNETAKHDTYLEPKRSAELSIDGIKIGAFGEVKTAVLRRFKLETVVTACEINLDKIAQLPRNHATNFQVSKFPFVERDLTLKVSSTAQFGRFDQAILATLDAEHLITEVTPISVYQADPATKNISFHLRFSSPEQTLEQDQISAIMEKVTVAVIGLGAEIV